MAIRSFKGRETERLFREGHSGRWCNIASVAIRKLDMLDAAETLSEMRAPPGNRLEALRGDRTGQDSVRINDQWRICFRWTDQGPTEVEIVDYHR